MKYPNTVVEELRDWLYECSVQKHVVVNSNTESGEVLGRWQFDIECDETTKDDSAPRDNPQKASQGEIYSVVRQITTTDISVATGSVLFIWTTDLYKAVVVPKKWEELGPQFITHSEQVHLRSFTTTIHKANSTVAYKILSMTGDRTRTVVEFSSVYFLKPSQLQFMFYSVD